MKTARLGLLLITAGILITLIAAILSATSPSGNTGFAGCIIILVIPICWGFGSEQVFPILMVVVAILAVIMIINLAMVYIARKHHRPDHPS